MCTYFSHYEYGFHQRVSGSSSPEEVPEEFFYAMNDEWVINEVKVELVRIHKKMFQFLDTMGTTIKECSKDKIETKEDDWKVAESSTARSSEPWKVGPSKGPGYFLET